MPPGNRPRIPQRDLALIHEWIKGSIAAPPTPQPDQPPSTNETPTASAQQSQSLLGEIKPLTRLTPITALAIHPTSPILAVSGHLQVLLYNLATSTWLGAIPFQGEIHCLRFSNDGKVLLVAGGVGAESGRIIAYNVDTWTTCFAIEDDTDSALAADILPSRGLVAWGGPNRVVKVATISDCKIKHTLTKATDWVMSLKFSPDGFMLAYGDRFGGLHIAEALSGNEFATLRGHTKSVTAIDWQADSNVLITASEDGTVRSWDMHRLVESHRWNAHPEGVLALTLTGEKTIVTAGRDRHVRSWTERGDLVADLGAAQDVVFELAASSADNQVVSGNWSGQVARHSLTDRQSSFIDVPIFNESSTLPPLDVPVPILAKTGEGSLPPTSISLDDFARKKAALQAIETAAELMKEQAARHPNDPSLTKAYLQICEAAVAMKADLLRFENRPATP
jgi:WD40 repeat protein